MKPEKIDVLKRKSVDFNELDKDLKVEVAVLGGLDIFTDIHVQGVVKKTKKICDALNLDYEKTKKCVLAAYLHDVGKIMVPPEILQKQGKLTDEEFEIMKKHTIYGYDICMKFPQFRVLAPIVRAHHENNNGTGYPDGLKEDQIPEEAKLIKIADIFDALTQRRQYKEGFKPSKALSIMIEDVDKGKTGALYLYYFLLYTIDEYYLNIVDVKNTIKKKKEELEVLTELEDIYKQIYDRGLTNGLKRKLSNYELQPGYDMTANERLLVMNKQALEKANAAYEDYMQEYKTLKEQAKYLKKKITFKEKIHRLR